VYGNHQQKGFGIMFMLFALIGILTGHVVFVVAGLALDSRDVRAQHNMRAVVREMEGGKL